VKQKRIFLVSRKVFYIYNVYLLNLNIVTMTHRYWSLHFLISLLLIKLLSTFINTVHENWQVQVKICTALLHVYCEIV